MEPTSFAKQTPNAEPAPTRRALDPFFETDERRDHANQWDLAAVWPEPAAGPKKTDRRALDPFFETDEQRDHANQWDVTAVWPEPAAEPKKTKPVVDKR